MRFKACTWFLSVVFSVTIAAHAQGNFHVSQLPDFNAGSLEQPAFLAIDTTVSWQLGAGATAWVQNSDAALAPLWRTGNRLDAAAKADILADLDGPWEGRLGYEFNFLNARTRIGSWPLQLNLRQREVNRLYVGQPTSIGLLLNGNAPYAGQTLTDENIYFQRSRFTSLGVATARKLGKKTWYGARLKLIAGQTATELNDGTYSLFTETDGAFIETDLRYELWQSQREPRFPGWGAALDVGIYRKYENGTQIQLSFRDIGAVRWQARSATLETSGRFEGVDLRAALEDVEDIGIDEIENEFYPDNFEDGAQWQPTPGRFTAIYRRPLGERAFGFVNVRIPLVLIPTEELATMHLGYHYRVTNWLELGGGGYVGGVEGYGLSLLGAVRWRGLRFFVTSDNLLGGLYFGRGLVVRSGLEWRIE